MIDGPVVEFFSSYAYQPMFVYGFIVLFMTASSFGLPIPEEMTLLSAGLVAYMARNPDQFPPPTPDAEGVNLVVLSIVCFVAVLGSDILIYFLGKIFGRRIIKTKFFNNRIGHEPFDKINKIFQKYSYWACGLFRFAPGVRFPGHLSCGLMGIPLWQFVMVDGLAALVSVPTQVLLVANYGDVILDKVKQFKMALGVIILIVLLIWLGKKLIHHFKKKRVN